MSSFNNVDGAFIVVSQAVQQRDAQNAKRSPQVKNTKQQSSMEPNQKGYITIYNIITYNKISIDSYTVD